MPTLSIQHKVTFAIIAFVILTASVVGTISQITARGVIEKRVLEQELPTSIKKINNTINNEISSMKTIARLIANDTAILNWFAAGRDADGEKKLIDKLKYVAESDKLSVVSFADRESGHYWNQDGYLRQLENNAEDGWFYQYRDSGLDSSVSIYVYPDNIKTEVFVNYQQVDGIGLSGTSKSFEDIVEMLNQFRIEETGFVFLTDEKGIIKVHRNKALLGKSLTSVYGTNSAKTMLNQQDMNLSEVMIDDSSLIIASSFIPSAKWYVVAQVPKSEIFSAVNQATFTVIVSVVLVSIFAIAVAWIIGRSITRPINQLAQLFQKLGHGNADISFRLPETGQKELSVVAQGYNHFIDKLESNLAMIGDATSELRNISGALDKTTQETIASSTTNEDNTHHISQSLTQISETVATIAENATQASNIADNIQTNGQSVTQAVGTTKQDISGLADKINDVANVINSLTVNTETIANALSVIETISDQTNLLALNAAIEAARAGEHGRGFAVVAEEVRTLAAKTADSTTQIQSIMETLKVTSQNATHEIDQILEQSKQTTSSIENSQNLLNVITELTDDISDINRLVATATEEQIVTLENINSNMSGITETAQINMTNMHTLAEETVSINQLAEQLDQLSLDFKGK